MRIHMIGVGGISMRGLARYLMDGGHEVSGCDVNEIILPDLSVTHGHSADHIVAIDQVVINSAITASHPGWVEVEAAQVAGIPVIKRAAKIGDITRERETIAISGTHGKSTTTGMVAHLLLESGLDPFVMIGAPVPAFNRQTYRPGAGPLVLEADEFDRSFLQFSPQVIVLTNIEPDHLDYYTGGLPEIRETFAAYLDRINPGGTIIVFGDDPNIQTILQNRPPSQSAAVITYGRLPGNDYRIVDGHLGEGKNSFALVLPNQERVTVTLEVPGLFNQENATATFIVGLTLGIKEEQILSSLPVFHGVGMRFEVLYDQGVTVISDYGHHPTEVAVTTTAAKAWFPGRRLVLVFQPHQYSRTQVMFDEFVEALNLADEAIVTDIYGVAGREGEVTVRASDLAAGVVTATGQIGRYVPTGELVGALKDMAQPGDVILMMGAGLDIRPLAEELVKNIGAAIHV